MIIIQTRPVIKKKMIIVRMIILKIEFSVLFVVLVHKNPNENLFAYFFNIRFSFVGGAVKSMLFKLLIKLGLI